jgi:hypothetical protein
MRTPTGTLSALTETDPLLPMKVDPANARELVIGFAGRQPPFSGADTRRVGSGVLDRETVGRTEVAIAACDSFFVRLRGPFLRPGLRFSRRRAQRRSSEERSNPEPRAARYSEHGEVCEHRTLTAASTAQRWSLAGKPKPRPTGFVVHSMPDIGAAATWAGGAAGLRDRD